MTPLLTVLLTATPALLGVGWYLSQTRKTRRLLADLGLEPSGFGWAASAEVDGRTIHLQRSRDGVTLWTAAPDRAGWATEAAQLHSEPVCVVGDRTVDDALVFWGEESLVRSALSRHVRAHLRHSPTAWLLHGGHLQLETDEEELAESLQALLDVARALEIADPHLGLLEIAQDTEEPAAVRMACFGLLTDLNPEFAVPVAEAWLNDEKTPDALRARACTMAAVHAPSSLAPILPRLLLANEQLRRAAVDAMLTLDIPVPPEVIDALLRARDPRSQLLGLQAVGRNPSPDWEPYVLRLLDNDDTQVVEGAAFVAGQLGGEDTLRQLAPLTETAEGSLAETIRRAIESVRARIGEGQGGSAGPSQ